MQQARGDCVFMALHVPAALLTLYEYTHIKQVFANMGDVVKHTRYQPKERPPVDNCHW